MTQLHPAPPVVTHPDSLVPLVALAIVLAVVLVVGAYVASRR